MFRTQALCETHATDMVEAIAAKSTNWTRDSALLSYIGVDAEPVPCAICGAEGMTYSEPCWDSISFIGSRIVPTFSPRDMARLGA